MPTQFLYAKRSGREVRLEIKPCHGYTHKKRALEIIDSWERNPRWDSDVRDYWREVENG